jgi:hypothetical protein
VKGGGKKGAGGELRWERQGGSWAGCWLGVKHSVLGWRQAVTREGEGRVLDVCVCVCV